MTTASATFLNLPADKRERFIAAALEEFASHPYDTASVTRIVAELGIAKGSVYQYFKNKFGLFEYLVSLATEREMEWHEQHPADPGLGFQDRVRAMVVSGLSWALLEPRWARVGLRAMEQSKEPRLQALRKMQRETGHAYTVGMLTEAVARGEIRGDLDLELVASFVGSMFTGGLMDALTRQSGVELSDLADDPDLGRTLSELHLERVVDGALVLIMQGLASR